MSVIFMDSFDCETVTTSPRWDGGISVSGTGSGRFGTGQSMGLANVSNAYRLFAAAEQHATMIVQFALYPIPSNGTILSLNGDSGSTNHFNLALASSGTALGVYRGGTLLGTTTAILAPSTWNYIEVKVVLHDTTGAITVKINSTTALTLTSQDTKNAGTAAVFDRLGLHNGWSGSTWYIDDLVVMNGAGAANNDFIGDTRIVALFPNGNGNYSQLVGSDNNSTDNYLLVDENPTPSEADYVGSSVVGEKDTYTYADLAGAVDSVKAVQVTSHLWKSESAPRKARRVTRIGATDYTGADLTLTASMVGNIEILETSPATAVAWTGAEIDGAEFGVEVRT